MINFSFKHGWVPILGGSSETCKFADKQTVGAVRASLRTARGPIFDLESNYWLATLGTPMGDINAFKSYVF